MGLLEFRSVEKRFGSLRANAAVSFSLPLGSIHAIVGENGAGKSTAMKILYGQLKPDSGDILIDGKKITWNSPQEAKAFGIGMVHQHFMLSGPHSVLENILLMENRGPFSPYEKTKAREKIEKIAKEFGLEVPLDSKVEDCCVGLQQRVEILKILYSDASILILDEPTAVLTPQEIEDLFHQLHKLKAQGKTILIITHKLKEVLALADSVSVFRAGAVVKEAKISDCTLESLAEAMIGRKVSHKNSLRPQSFGPVVLDAVDFQVREGEILGIAGVEGNGQSDWVRSLLKLPKGIHKGITVFGQRLEEIPDLRAAGVGVLAEDRLHQSLLLDFSLEENLLLGYHRRKKFLGSFFYDRKSLQEHGRALLESFDVRPRKLSALARSLSGGNQQKFVVARELGFQPKLLLACHPTRGVDIGAIESIHDELEKMCAAGGSVLLISSELEELMKLSDRIKVLYRGKFVAEFSKKDFSEQKIGLAMAGQGNL